MTKQFETALEATEFFDTLKEMLNDERVEHWLKQTDISLFKQFAEAVQSATDVIDCLDDPEYN